MLKRYRSLPAGVIALVAVLSAASAAPAVAQMETGGRTIVPSAPIAGEQVGGTLLTVQPAIAFERAVLRVLGPAGYALRKTVTAAGPITVDLLADASQPTRKLLDLEAGVPAPKLEQLADGIYRYETVFYDAAGKRSVHTGRFFVEFGTAVSRATKRGQLGEVRQELEQARTAQTVAPEGVSPPPQNSIQDADFLYLNDLAADGEVAVVLDDDSPGSVGGVRWGMANDGSTLQFGKTNSISAINTPYVHILDGGNVGIGTSVPTERLHVDSGTASVLRLTGQGGFDMALGVGGAGWGIFDNDGDLPLRFDHTAGALAIDVNGSGVIINGDLSAGSSREVKTAFADLDAADVLARVNELPLQSWRFKSDPAQAQHVGPIAEDFHAAFGLGIDDKHLSPSDTAGVALVAIQALSARVDALATENKHLQEELARLLGRRRATHWR